MMSNLLIVFRISLIVEVLSCPNSVDPLKVMFVGGLYKTWYCLGVMTFLLLLVLAIREMLKRHLKETIETSESFVISNL